MVCIREVSVDIVADVHLVGHPTLREKQVDQLAGVHPGVLVGVGNDCRHSRHRKNLSYRVPAQPETTLMSLRNKSIGLENSPCGCSKLAPVDVGLDEKGANDASHHAKE